MPGRPTRPLGLRALRGRPGPGRGAVRPGRWEPGVGGRGSSAPGRPAPGPAVAGRGPRRAGLGFPPWWTTPRPGSRRRPDPRWRPPGRDRPGGRSTAPVPPPAEGCRGRGEPAPPPPPPPPPAPPRPAPPGSLGCPLVARSARTNSAALAWDTVPAARASATTGVSTSRWANSTSLRAVPLRSPASPAIQVAASRAPWARCNPRPSAAATTRNHRASQRDRNVASSATASAKVASSQPSISPSTRPRRVVR